MSNNNNPKFFLETTYTNTDTQIQVPGGRIDLFSNDFPYEITYEFRNRDGEVTSREVLSATGKSSDKLIVSRAYEKCPTSDTATTQTQTAVTLQEGGIIEARVTAGWMNKQFNKAIDTLDNILTGVINKHFTSTEKTKLSGIQDGAQVNYAYTSSDIKSLYEANSNTNAFTDAFLSKLNGIAYNANNYSLPIATTSILGGVKGDGTTVSIAGDGTISALGASGATVEEVLFSCKSTTSVTIDIPHNLGVTPTFISAISSYTNFDSDIVPGHWTSSEQKTFDSYKTDGTIYTGAVVYGYTGSLIARKLVINSVSTTNINVTYESYNTSYYFNMALTLFA